MSDAKLALDFSKYFNSKISDIRNGIISSFTNEDFSVDCRVTAEVSSIITCFRPIGAEDVRRYIGQLNKTCCALDPLNVSKLPLVMDSAAPYIAEIINKVFGECNFVISEKVDLLRPLIKKPDLDRESMANYRPISNLSFLSKLIEHAVLDQLLPVLQQNSAIPSFQSAYRKFHSTETALCKIYNDLVINSCQGRTTLLVLLDLSAAFDTVDHQLLLGDFSACGVRDSALALLESYLTD